MPDPAFGQRIDEFIKELKNKLITFKNYYYAKR
jgi:hypothetical protein